MRSCGRPPPVQVGVLVLGRWGERVLIQNARRSRGHGAPTVLRRKFCGSLPSSRRPLRLRLDGLSKDPAQSRVDRGADGVRARWSTRAGSQLGVRVAIIASGYHHAGRGILRDGSETSNAHRSLAVCLRVVSPAPGEEGLASKGKDKRPEERDRVGLLAVHGEDNDQCYAPLRLPGKGPMLT